MKKLPASFYVRPDVVQLSKELLGKFLFTKMNGALTGGIIVETEAYAGAKDRASHAYNNRRTQRTDIMYAQGGVSYVYLCYGIHSLFNVITNKKGVPDAVLIRAIEPVEGAALMLKRRKKKQADYTLCAGPGALTQALGITCRHNGMELRGKTIWIADDGIRIPSKKIIAGPRVGVHYAGEHAKLPWRFRIKDNPWCSRAK